MTLALDVPRVMAIALALGAAGIPLAFWLMREENLRNVEKIMLGLCMGWTVIPLLFLLETIAGIKYDPKLIAVHWSLLVAAGAALWVREIAMSKEGFSKFMKMPSLSLNAETLEQMLPCALLSVLLIVSVWIPLTAAGGLISEVDPYYYLDGVQQIVTHGSNYLNDSTSWYPLITVDHRGQPLFKYLLAPIYSLYMPAGAQYSPYTLQSTSSIYPPLMMGLAVFFVYFLFRELYHPRAGLLVGGIVAFMPVMLNEMQAGKSQITPYNIFALFFFLAMFYAMIKRRSWNFTALSILAYAALILGSNMEILLVFCLSIFLAIMGVMQLLKPTKEGEELNLRIAVFIGGMLLVQILYALYYTQALDLYLLKNMIKSVALPAAAIGGPLLFGFVIDKIKYRGAEKGQTGLPMAAALILVALALFHLAGTIAILPILLMVLLFNPAANWVRTQPHHARLEMCILLIGALVLVGTIAPDLPVASDMFDSYRFFGSYANALTRTISEQGAGASSFDGYFGASGLSLGAPPSSEKLGEVIATAIDQTVKSAVGLKPFELIMSIVSILNIIPTMLLNLFYNAAAAFMNLYLEKGGVQADFLVAKDSAGNIDLFGGRVNSLASMFLFLGPVLLLIVLARAWKRGSQLPIGALLLLCFIVPVTFMGFMKVKMLIFLAVAFVFSLGAAWVEGERLFMEFMARRAEKKSEKTGAAAGDWFSSWPAHPRHIAWMLVVFAVLLQMGWPTYLAIDANPSMDAGYTQTYAIGAAILAHSATPTLQQDPQAGFKALNLSCVAYNVPAACEAVNNQNATLNEPLRFYNSDLCYFSLVGNQSAKLTQSSKVSFGYRCGYYPYNWLNMYEWMNTNINHSERITSWWDYGHWTNFFGRANTVLRPEHASTEMIGRVAYAYTHQSPLELRRVMKDYGSRYALMDSEIVGNAQSGTFLFGGKFSALNYLGCDWANRTSVQNQPGQSMCELENQPEQLLVPQRAAEISPCLISEATQEKGTVGYRMSYIAETGGIRRDAKAVYCVRPEQTPDGQSVGVYYLDQKDESGNLVRSPAIWLAQSSDANYLAFAAIYTKDPWATINGTLVSRWDYRFGPYYDNSLYQGFVLGQLEGFDLVYDYPQGLGGKIRIFKMKDEYYNKKE